MLINPRNWRKKRQGSQSVLDLDPSFYDLKSHLPANVQVGAYHTRPLVSLAEVHDHLILLKAFHALALREGTHFHRLADSAAFEYERWAQTVLPRQRQRRTSNSSKRRSSSNTSHHSHHSQSPSSSSPPSTPSLDSTPHLDLPHLPRRKQPTLQVSELPPLPVLMCWHAHLMNPRQFATDTEGAYAALADLNFPLAAVAEAIKTGSLPGEVEHVPGDALRPVPSISGWMPPDISAAVQRQARIVAAAKEAGWLEMTFINGPITPFQRGIVRYHAWLDLMAAAGQKLAPTVDIELVWRTHQLRGARFRLETQLILGRPMDQTDRGDELLLKMTAELWGKRFRGHEYVIAGRQQERMGGFGVLRPLLRDRRSTVP